jgi:hypothetical protein
MNTNQMMSLESLAVRIRGEYCEMPGLRLTVAQGCRLWQLDASTCEALLEQLVREAFLYKTPNGAYIALSLTAAPQLKAPLVRQQSAVPRSA